MFFRLLASLVLGIATTSSLATEAAWSVEKMEDDVFFALQNDEVTDLSGIVWTGGDRFYAVSNHLNALIPITLKLDRESGKILTGEIGQALPFATEVGDLEGITYVRSTKTFYLSAETGNKVVRYTLGQTRAITLAVPPVFSRARKNLSLESITWNDQSAQFWIANEETLNNDGPLASPTGGSYVRLQQFDAKFRPVAQYGWITEPANFRFHGVGNGVADLCALPDGQLLVLERGFGPLGLRMRIFLADFKKATPTSRKMVLNDPNCIFVKKILLYEKDTGLTNFEGLTLGPMLADGSYSLVAVADSNGTNTHCFLALKLRSTKNPKIKLPTGDQH